MKTYKEYLLGYMSHINSLKNSVFIGQQIIYYGNPMSKTFELSDKNKFIETPVFEETQMGMSLGLAMTNKFVITLYPRWDFLICAANQLINHVDKFELMTNKKNHMIIRVGKGSDYPLDPGHQHKGNYLNEFKILAPNITFFDCVDVQSLIRSYDYAINNKGVYVINEYPELYDTTN
jgi:pyruvate/2-oxoglutarate/acetoin dehydrogenase E1 component